MMQNHRSELRNKVEKRQQQLNRALKNAEGKKLPEAHVIALTTELRSCEDALTGGWDKMPDVVASQLARWLEQTDTLVGGETNATSKLNTVPNAPSEAGDKKDKVYPAELGQSEINGQYVAERAHAEINESSGPGSTKQRH